MYSKAFDQAKDHARFTFPEEMCGFVIGGEFIAVKNNAADPSEHVEELCTCRLCTFVISAEDTIKLLPQAQMVLHSHPNGNAFPSKMDMEGQMLTGVPWGLVSLDEDRIGNFEIWGDSLEIAPLLGRNFTHGIRDCYSLIRDTFRTGKDKLKQMEITSDWPFDPITLINKPRGDGWWAGEDDFYSAHFREAGFVEISREDARAGDCFMLKFRSEKFNHAGVLISNDLVMHHLPNRLSRREPAGAWARAAERWLRYVGEQK